MSRRGGGDKLFNRNKKQKENDLVRNKAERKKLVRIIIACEGTETEPLYFQKFFKYLVKERSISATSFVIAKHGHTDPKGVLKDLENYKDGKDTYRDFKHKWIVIDRDEERTNGGGHTLKNYNEAISRAKQLKVKVAYSNPSFEIWYLLHFQYQSAYIDRTAVNTKLKKRLIKYDKADKNIYELLLKKQDFAIANAKKLIEQCEQQGDNIEHCNPSTTVYKLVKLLNDQKAP